MKLFILGIPITNFSKEETAEAALKLAEEKRAQYIGTANINFYANIYGLSLTRPRNPELLEILRSCRIVSADGMPVVWLSKLLGAPLKERVTGIDLTLAVCRKLQKPLYLLGGDEKLVDKAEKNLKKLFSHLAIAGTMAPKIAIAGEELANAREQDALLLEELNKSGAAVLLLNLGNPKQEIWFERIKDRLEIPLTIGIGGSFKFISKTVSRAPPFMQNLGLEWLWRLFQEPKYLWKRYLVCGAKFLYMALPLVIYHWANALIFQKRREPAARQNLLFLSPHKAMAMLVFPKALDGSSVEQMRHRIKDAFSREEVILDFRSLRHLDLHGITLLFEMWHHAEAAKKKLYAISIKANVRLLLKLHRIYDMVEPDLYTGPEELASRLSHERSPALLYCSVDQAGPFAVITLFGKLDSHQDYPWHKEQFRSILQHRECILDLTYCTYIDNGGIGFLLELNKGLEEPLKLCGLSPAVKHELHLADAEKLFPAFPDLNSAMETLYNPRRGRFEKF